jgi:hypothetical protein
VPFNPQLRDPGNELPLAVALSWIEGVEPLHSVVSGEASTDTELSIETVTVPDPAQVGLLRSVTFTMYVVLALSVVMGLAMFGSSSPVVGVQL